MNRSTHLLLGALAAVVLTDCAAAEPVARIQVSEVKPLLIAAIEHGSARGVLVGAGAAYVRQKFGSGAPIEIDVRALHALPQRGCSRLEVTTRQRDVMEQAKRSDKELTYQVSYCRDGRFPERR
jgi:hypothetical protein